MPRISRRELLGAVAFGGVSGLAGCLGNRSAGPSVPTDSRPSATPVEDDPPTYEPYGSRSKDLSGTPFVRARIATLPKPVPFEPWIELVQQPGPETVGKLTVGLTNRDDQPWTVSGGSLNPSAGGASDAGVWVGYGQPKFENGCPTAPGISKGSRDIDTVLPNRSVSTTYNISVIHDNDVCFPAGEHRFSGYQEVYSSRDADSPALAFRWWFTLIAE